MNDTKTLADILRNRVSMFNISGNKPLVIEAADRLEELERELAESRQWSSKLADVGDDLRADLAAERALADRLASVLTIYNHDLLAGEMIQFVPEHDTALAAWKEARSE